ncbi:MAG: TlpA family protein disulfide reductase [Actinomycetota bacterium]|nr:TlpA family protein disulfide reductase [Actinomycetota bacterium]
MRRSVVLCLLLVVSCSRTAPTPRSEECRARGIAQVGDRLPDCTFRTLDGSSLKLADLKGTPVLLNFWASWCPNCVQELPALEKTSALYAGRVRFIGADLLGLEGETESSAKAFAGRFHLSYTSILDRKGLLYGHFSPRLFPPTTIFADAQGVIRFRKFGPMTEREIHDNIARYLAVR